MYDQKHANGCLFFPSSYLPCNEVSNGPYSGVWEEVKASVKPQTQCLPSNQKGEVLSEDVLRSALLGS